MKSQRNTKELSKSAGANRAHGASPSASENAALAGFSESGGSVATVYEIGPFRLDPQGGVVTRVGIVESLGPRAVAVLAFLVQNANEPVTKNAIMDAAWPGLVVEEGNLSVQISSIRRVLAQVPGGERWVETLARRGYRFVGPVSELQGGVPQTAQRDRIAHLPKPLTSFVGRERELIDLKRLLGKNRLLTLVGTGGIGKTRLALQLAAEVKDAYRDGIFFIDFAPLDDPALVPNVAAQALGVQQSGDKSLVEALCRRVTEQRLLLIFDNCEHVLDTSARLAEAMLRGDPEPTIIATSREPLRINGEQVYRLPSLSLPDPAANFESIRQSDAVLLFVDRAQHQQSDFVLSAALAPRVAQLCVRLDGIPFALELAAALVPTCSIDEINGRLDDRFNLLRDGSRTALPRQQTLRATLDWSHGLLSEIERCVLRRVSIFAGGFSLAAAVAIATNQTITAPAVGDVLAQLVTRSLIVADTTDAGTRYRLLETIRAYGSEKLDDAGEAAEMQRRHAQYFSGLFQRAVDEWLHLPEANWRGHYLPEIDNVRAALQWSLGTNGDAQIAVALAGATGPIWPALTLYGEGAQRLRAAAERVHSGTPVADQARLSFWLASADEEAMPARSLQEFERAVALYEKLGDQTDLAHAMLRLSRLLTVTGRFEASAAALAKAWPAIERSQVPRLLAIYFYHAAHLKTAAGDLAAARACHEQALMHFRDGGFIFGALGAQGALADVTWALGDLAAAEASFREVIAMRRSSPLVRKGSLGFQLGNLAGVLIERGDLASALIAAREALPLLSGVGNAWLFMEHLALRTMLVGSVANAARVAGFAAAAFDTNEVQRQPNEARAHARLYALLRERIESDELKGLLAQGAEMTEEEACRIALAN